MYRKQLIILNQPPCLWKMKLTMLPFFSAAWLQRLLYSVMVLEVLLPNAVVWSPKVSGMSWFHQLRRWNSLKLEVRWCDSLEDTTRIKFECGEGGSLTAPKAVSRHMIILLNPFLDVWLVSSVQNGTKLLVSSVQTRSIQPKTLMRLCRCRRVPRYKRPDFGCPQCCNGCVRQHWTGFVDRSAKERSRSSGKTWLGRNM